MRHFSHLYNGNVIKIQFDFVEKLIATFFPMQATLQTGGAAIEMSVKYTCTGT